MPVAFNFNEKVSEIKKATLEKAFFNRFNPTRRPIMAQGESQSSAQKYIPLGCFFAKLKAI
ncbi:hypothetical protein THMIRHAS_20040 [Thiosulfatimonas sediminis]|uniref:Uncharacterized protein n=1 Tax=Thiosulfatimonas sediminis TaxID=2675054 RepID=A0A6F8PWY0_9GAMM|nr:hypothetical protein THMIRHAS_20040 [Thiosulfatimonas sediminis]